MVELMVSDIDVISTVISDGEAEPLAAARALTTFATSSASPATKALVEQIEAHIGSFPSAIRLDP